MFEKMNEMAVKAYAHVVARLSMLKSRAKEERGAEAIEWIAMVMVVGVFMFVISNFIKTGEGKSGIEGIFSGLFDALKGLVGSLFKLG